MRCRTAGIRLMSVPWLARGSGWWATWLGERARPDRRRVAGCRLRGDGRHKDGHGDLGLDNTGGFGRARVGGGTAGVLAVAGAGPRHRRLRRSGSSGGRNPPGSTPAAARSSPATAATDEPGGRLLVACRNRRASRCPPCAEFYRADTYQLIRAGLVGGKNVPDTVAGHPKVFATLTAPSFGPVHHQVVDPAGRVGPLPPRRQPRCGHRHDARRPGSRAKPLDPAATTTRRRSSGTPWHGGPWARTTTWSTGPWPRLLGVAKRVPGPGRAGVGGQGGRVPSPGRRSLPRHHPPRRPRTRLAPTRRRHRGAARPAIRTAARHGRGRVPDAEAPAR